MNSTIKKMGRWRINITCLTKAEVMRGMAKYPDLKSYLQENYIELFTSEIKKFVDSNFDGGGFHSINVLPLGKFLLRSQNGPTHLSQCVWMARRYAIMRQGLVPMRTTLHRS